MIYRLVLFLLTLQFSFVLFAQEVTKISLKSDYGKDVTIKYSIKRNGTYADVSFSSAYVKNFSELILLFAKNNYDIKLKRGSLPLDKFAPNDPYSITHLNNDNYHVLDDVSSIRIERLTNNDRGDSLVIPIYLAEDKNNKYDLKDICYLSIKIPKVGSYDKKNNQLDKANRENINDIVQLVDYNSGNECHDEDIIDISDCDYQAEEIEKNEKTIQRVKNHLKEAQDLLDNPVSLNDLIEMDEMLKIDKRDIEQIDPSNSLKDEIKSIRDNIKKIIKEQDQAVQDSISATAKQEAEAAQQRNMWLIIGGIILAVLGFVGNQVFQHVRNARNQRNMMSMQQSMVQRAENEAKRRAQSMARQKVNQVQNAARRKSQDYVRGNINSGISKISKGKKNKGFSI